MIWSFVIYILAPILILSSEAQLVPLLDSIHHVISPLNLFFSFIGLIVGD